MKGNYDQPITPIYQDVLFNGIKIVDSWMLEKGKAIHIEEHNMLFVHPEDTMNICLACNDFEAALQQLRTVIHHKIDHGYYGRGKRA
jgi:hypothetical protein